MITANLAGRCWRAEMPPPPAAAGAVRLVAGDRRTRHDEPRRRCQMPPPCRRGVAGDRAVGERERRAVASRTARRPAARGLARAVAAGHRHAGDRRARARPSMTAHAAGVVPASMIVVRAPAPRIDIARTIQLAHREHVVAGRHADRCRPPQRRRSRLAQRAVGRRAPAVGVVGRRVHRARRCAPRAAGATSARPRKCQPVDRATRSQRCQRPRRGSALALARRTSCRP